MVASRMASKRSSRATACREPRHDLGPARQEVLEDAAMQRLLRLEVIEQRRLGHSDGVGDLAGSPCRRRLARRTAASLPRGSWRVRPWARRYRSVTCCLPNGRQRRKRKGASACRPAIRGMLAHSMIFARPRVLILFPLGFAAGLPYMLVSLDALGVADASRRLARRRRPASRRSRCPIRSSSCGRRSSIAIAPPLGGRRRGWIVLFQLALGAALVALGATSPRAARSPSPRSPSASRSAPPARTSPPTPIAPICSRPTSAPPAPPSMSSAIAPPCSSPAVSRSSPPTTYRSVGCTSSRPRCSPSASSPR